MSEGHDGMGAGTTNDPGSVITELDHGVLSVTLNEPDSRNALSDEIKEGLADAAQWAERDANVRSVLLTGKGAAFCAGGDVKGMSQRSRDPVERAARLASSHRDIVVPLLQLGKPVVAAVNGWAVGAGVSLSLCADLRVAAESSKFLLAFIRVGLVPDFGALYLLPRVIGLGRAMELAMLGEPIDAARAEEIGLVNQVVSDDRLLEQSMAVATKLANGPTAAIAATKQGLLRSFERDLATCLEVEAAMQGNLGASADHAEGVSAFVDKRPARFGSAT
jgi:2-(1,2-epoxy-1,2-dihydrophenyl)acetyl-CoA isomerase